jgi:acetoacetyl-CoA synthetase
MVFYAYVNDVGCVVDALLYGTHIVFYEGSPAYKNLMPLWEIAEKEEITILGTSASFIPACIKISLGFRKQFNLKKLK